MSTTTSLPSFRYQAQTRGGHAISGQIDAPSADDAHHALLDSGLSVIELEQAEQRSPRPRRLGGADFVAFNEQLAQLTKAGLPIEEGLRLIAQDMPSRRMADAVQRVVDELESGTPLEEAFEKHRGHFPPLYAQLVAAGVRSHQLPAVLFSLGRYLELLARLRATLWRACAYPAMVFLSIAAVLVFIGYFIVPPFEDIMADFGAEVPALTTTVFTLAQWTPHLAGALVLLVLAVALCGVGAIATGRMQALIDHVLMPIPLIGPILQRNLVARWCDGLRLGVEAGLDLPAAIAMASDVTASPRAQHDGQALIETIEVGRPLNVHPPLRTLPRVVPVAMHLGAERHDLAGVLADLARLYQQQAEFRVQTMQMVLTPVFLLLMAFVIGTIVGALFLPLVSLMNELM
ncbi:MAG: type II secretion system F family protein [Phycisphaeraceae bacterium]